MSAQLALAEIDKGNKVQPKKSAFIPKLDRDKVLFHELQLGKQLNHSVHDTRRNDFSLLLAMLAQDVREQSQFSLPQVKTISSLQKSYALRKQFNLPNQQPLALAKFEGVKQFNQAHHIADDNLTQLRLTDALQPKPLSFRDDNKFINSQITQNTSVLTQVNLQQLSLKNQQAKISSEDLTNVNATVSTFDDKTSDYQTLNALKPLNVDSWLGLMQQSKIKASQIS